MPRGIPAKFPSHQQLRYWERVCRYLDWRDGHAFIDISSRCAIMRLSPEKCLQERLSL